MFEPGNVLIGTAPTVISEANTERRGLFIRNMSDNKIYFGFGYPAELNKGLILFPNESYSMTENDFCRCAISAISATPNSLVLFQEYSMVGRL